MKPGFQGTRRGTSTILSFNGICLSGFQFRMWFEILLLTYPTPLSLSLLLPSYPLFSLSLSLDFPILSLLTCDFFSFTASISLPLELYLSALTSPSLNSQSFPSSRYNTSQNSRELIALHFSLSPSLFSPSPSSCNVSFSQLVWYLLLACHSPPPPLQIIFPSSLCLSFSLYVSLFLSLSFSPSFSTSLSSPSSLLYF